MSSCEFAIQMRDLLLAYRTPTKKPILPGLPIRIVSSTSHVVLDGLQLNVRKGCITALLGENGSGKTSLIKLISGIRTPQRGEVRVFGLAPQKVRHRIGVCLGNSLIYHRLTARENLEYFGRLYGVSRIDRRIAELAATLELERVMDHMVETFSFGMKAKLAIARSLIHSPDLLILDEPTLGIDLHLARQIRSFIRSLKCTVLLTTHYMEEAELLSDDLCILEKGRLMASGAKSDVLAKFGVTSVPDAFTAAVKGKAAVRQAS